MTQIDKAILSRPEYEFIYSNENLNKNIIYLTLSGSIGYGTNLDDSDIDIRGVSIERKECIYGFNCFEQFEELNTDTVIYGLKKFVTLAAKGNPNILELLGTNEEHIVCVNKYGRLLRENKEMFLSKRIINTFGNYATAQLRRLQNALARDQYPQDEKEKHILNSLNGQMKHFIDNYTDFDKGQIRLFIDKTDKDDRGSEIFMDVQLNKYPVRDFVNIYSEMNNVIRDYDRLNHRNRKKDDRKLYKHAMHLIRLLIMGTEILNTYEINTYRKDEHELLMNIRNGKVGFNELFNLVEHYEAKFSEAAKKTCLPEQPDERKIENLLISIYEDHYKERKHNYED